jgi:hypothetical protein
VGRTIMNRRKCSTELSCDDIKELEAAKDHAKALGLELNTHLIFAPYLDDDVYLDDVDDPIPSPSDIAAIFERLLKYVSVWVSRRGVRFTYIRVAHSSDNGTGHNPHLHVLLHLPNAKLRQELQAALTAVHGYTHGGGLVAMVKIGTDRRIRDKSGYWGSTFDYITRHKTQQAFIAGGRSTWRASRRDAKGKHRGIKCPFVGRRWNVSRNINAKARQAQRDGAAVIAARAAQRIADERQSLAA